MSTILVAVFVAVAAIVSPMIASGFTIRQQRVMKREDYAREDIVADRAAAAAEANAKRQDAIAAQTAEAARLLLEKQNAIALEVQNVKTTAAETAGLLVSANSDIAHRVEGVASAAAETAHLLVAANAEVADKVKVVAENANQVNEKLDVIHVLVNSAMTAAIQSEYDATVNNLAMMREVVQLRRAAGQGEPEPEMTAAIGAAETKITSLRETLAERRRQDELAKAQSVKIVSAEGIRRRSPTPKDS